MDKEKLQSLINKPQKLFLKKVLMIDEEDKLIKKDQMQTEKEKYLNVAKKLLQL
jgi:hypothetical protein